jgi:SAM-dependent methyltransferase
VTTSISDLTHRHYPESRYGGFADIDGTVKFYVRVRSLIQPDTVVLDIGCGRGEVGHDDVPFHRQLRDLRNSATKVIGIDVDKAADQNPRIDQFRLITTSSWPIEDKSIDICISDWVIEHLEDPRALFTEGRRVLKDGGYLCIRTLNTMSYVGIAARALPSRTGRNVLGRIQPNRDQRQIFPTFYRCNTRRRLRAAMESAGFTSYVYTHHPDPTYLGFSSLFYHLGVWQERLTPRRFGPTLLAFGRAESINEDTRRRIAVVRVEAENQR